MTPKYPRDLKGYGRQVALGHCPEVAALFTELGHEIACHGWINYHAIDETIEREHMALGMAATQRSPGASISRTTGRRPTPSTPTAPLHGNEHDHA